MLIIIILIVFGGVINAIRKESPAGFKSPLVVCLAFIWVMLFLAGLAFLLDPLFK